MLFAVEKCYPDHCGTQVWTLLPFTSRWSLHICLPWAKWDFLMSECVCICLSVCVCACVSHETEMLSHSHLKRAEWGTMEPIPRVIFCLNTTYPICLWLASLCLFLYLSLSFSLLLLFFFFLVFSIFSSAQGQIHCHNFCVGIWISKTLKYWARWQFF